MSSKTPFVVIGLLVAAAVGTATVVAAGHGSDGDKMAICHIPPGNPQQARTMEVSRSAWSAHEGHGDHEGACTGTEANKPPQPPPPPPQPPQPPPTRIGISHKADGDVDGDATFEVRVTNHGQASAIDVRVGGTLQGEGTWRLRSTHAAGCQIDGGRLACNLVDVPAGNVVTLHLAFDGDLAVCREAAIDLAVTAANDASLNDDRARGAVWVGACSPLDPPEP